MEQDPKMQGDDLPTQDAQTNEPVNTNPEVPGAVDDVIIEEESAQVVEPGAPVQPEVTVTDTVTAEAGSADAAAEPSITETVTETTVTQAAPLDSFTNSQSVIVDSPKPKRKGLVILLSILAVLALAIAGVAIWFFVFYSNPEKVALDAVGGFLGEKNIVMTGAIHNSDSEGPLVMATLDADTSGIANSSTLSLVLAPKDANGNSLSDDPYNLKIGNVMMSDGVFYLRTEELEESIQRFFTDNSISVTDDETAASIVDLAELVDDEWWQISVPDIIDAIDENGEDASEAKEFYSCMMNVLADSPNAQAAELYQQNHFLEVAKITNPTHGTSADVGFKNSLYSAKINYEQLANFANAAARTDSANQIYACYNKFSESMGSSERFSSDDFNISASDLSSNSNLDDFDIELEINNFTHQLVSISLYGKNDQKDWTISFAFKYQPVTITAPEQYRPITELIDELMAFIPVTPDYDFDDDSESPEIEIDYMEWNDDGSYEEV